MPNSTSERSNCVCGEITYQHLHKPWFQIDIPPRGETGSKIYNINFTKYHVALVTVIFIHKIMNKLG